MRAAVLGRPVGHSLSPVLHAAAYRELGLDWEYRAIDCGEAELPALVAGLGPDWAGLSLTMPLKRVALAVADAVDPLAAAVGAANTLLLLVLDIFDFGKAPLIFQTTDVGGFRGHLRSSASHFSYPGFPDGSGTILDATNVGDNVVFTLNVPTPGIYDVKVSYKQNIPRGIMQSAVNATNIGAPVDEFLSTGEGYAQSDLGNVNFSSAGNYK